MERSHSPFSFIWKTSKSQLILVFVIIVVGSGFYLYNKGNFFKQWNDWIDIYISLVTLLVAAFIWSNEKKEEWKRSLPKKLDIVYLLNNDVHAIVKNAPLTGEADIRNWGQSIAKTILNDKANIDFSGFETAKQGPDKERGVMVYKLTIFLRQSIPGIKDITKFEFYDNGDLKKD